MKQRDLATRGATAQLIDELSRGVCLGPERERAGTELAHFLYPNGRQGTTYPLNVLVWSNLSYVLGVMHPSQTPLEPEQELLIQKTFFDHLWDCSLTEMLDILGKDALPEITFEDLAEKLNQGINEHASAIHSFEEVYRHEIAGALGLVAPTAVSILEAMFQKSHGFPSELSDAEREAREQELHAFLVRRMTGDERRGRAVELDRDAVMGRELEREREEPLALLASGVRRDIWRAPARSA
jgi:hypothetical protein